MKCNQCRFAGNLLDVPPPPAPPIRINTTNSPFYRTNGAGTVFTGVCLFTISGGLPPCSWQGGGYPILPDGVYPHPSQQGVPHPSQWRGVGFQEMGGYLPFSQGVPTLGKYPLPPCQGRYLPGQSRYPQPG